MHQFSSLHALLIGVDDYIHPRFARLPATARDVQTIAAVLVDPARCGYPPANVKVLTGGQATADNIRTALQTLTRSVGPQSTVFIYFSGHGGRALENGVWRTYLCPREADPDDLPHTAIPGDEFSALINAIPAQRLLVILDACHAAGSADLKAADGTTVWKAGLPEDYYEALSQGSGRVVIASSKEDQFSYIRPQGDLSLFTYHLLQALSGKAAVRGDGLIHVLDFFHYVNEAVRADEARQTPILKVKDLDFNFPVALDRGGEKGRPASAVGEIATIRERIIRDPVTGAEILSRYLVTRPEWSDRRNEVDLKRTELERIQHALDLFGPNPEDQAAKNRVVYFLLRLCQELEEDLITGDGNVVQTPPSGFPPAPGGSGPESVERALLRIYTADERSIVGAGFLVAARVALTCDHVVAEARPAAPLPEEVVRLDFPFLAAGRLLTARVLRRDAGADVAVLELTDDPPATAAPLPLIPADPRDHPFRVFGFPVGHPEGLWVKGTIQGPNARGWYQIESETAYRIQKGFSGAPVWDDALNGAVGMVTAAERDPAVRAAFIIPTSLLPCAPHSPTPALSHFPNPFTDRLAICDPARFIGREDFLRRALQALESGSIAIVGDRKIGKSSLLWRLKWELERRAEWEVFLWDFFDPAADARSLLDEVTGRLGHPGKGWDAFKDAVRGRRVVLLLDELDLAPERGFDVDLLRGFRSLNNWGWPVRLVTAGRAAPQAIFPDPKVGSSPTDFLRPLRLGAFTEAEARRLLDHPWAPRAPRFDEATCAELMALARGHPYRLQVAAYHRYEALFHPAYDWRAGYEEEVAVLEA